MFDHSDSEIEDEDDMYVAVRILEEAKENGKWKYLIEWEDYPIGGATWEPPEHFASNRMLMDDWEEEKRKRRLGQSKPFDLNDWKKQQAQWEYGTSKRKQGETIAKKRAGRLAREKLEASNSDGQIDILSDETAEDPIDVCDDDYRQRRRAFKVTVRPSVSDDDDDSDVLVVPKSPVQRPKKKKRVSRTISCSHGHSRGQHFLSHPLLTFFTDQQRQCWSHRLPGQCQPCPSSSKTATLRDEGKEADDEDKAFDPGQGEERPEGDV